MPITVRPSLCSLAIAFVLTAGLAGCGSGNTPDSETAAGALTPVVQVTNYPLAYFAERIGGELVAVEFRAPADGDPAFWQPAADDIAAMQSADLVLMNGATYEKWATAASLPASVMRSTSASFIDSYIATEGDVHTHADGSSHSHGGIAFTTWIDFELARAQVRSVAEGIGGLVDEEDRGTVMARADALDQELQALDARLLQIAESIGDAPLVASHPVYQYFARRYGLRIEALMWEPETVPDDAAMADLAEIRADHAAAWMIWEGDPAPESVAKLDAIGVGSVVFAPSGNRPEVGDWMSVMNLNLDRLAAIAE